MLNSMLRIGSSFFVTPRELIKTKSNIKITIDIDGSKENIMHSNYGAGDLMVC